MKKLLVIALLCGTIVLQFCTAHKKAAGKMTQKVTYVADVQPLIAANCTPCHMPPQGNKKPYNTYAAVKSDIDEIISRVQRNPGEKGFMPARHPKLPDATIHVLVEWKNEGSLEK